MNYVLTALIAISSLLGGYIVHEQSTPNVGASQSISSLTELTSLSHNDVLPITEANGLTTKKVKWGTATSSMKAVFDPLYSPIFSTSAGLAGLLSDETGTSGGFVRAGSPSLTTPTMTSPVITLGSDATGDLYYRNAGVFTRLGIGTNGQLLTASTTGLPEWRDFSATFSTITVTGTSTLATTTVNGRNVTAFFGGDGSDGALSVTSGTTTLDIAGAYTLTKNYTSISISAGANLAFSNRATTTGSSIILRSQGSCNIQGRIYLVGVGAPGGFGGQSQDAAGGNGVDSNDWLDETAHYGTGAAGASGGAGAGGAAAVNRISQYATSTNLSATKSIYLVPGSGGGGGGAGRNNAGGDDGSKGGKGGDGSGSIYLECAGGYNFTGTILAQGEQGFNGVSPSSDDGGGGAGGGGSGGLIAVLYGSLVANSGTYSTAGGVGGTGAAGFVGLGGDGGGGGGFIYTAGNSGSVNSGTTGGDGGTGAAGYSFIMKNNVF